MTKEEISLRRRIKAGQELRDLSNHEMAVKMRMSLSAWERRLSHPGKITYLELCQLNKILKTNLMEGKQ